MQAHDHGQPKLGFSLGQPQHCNFWIVVSGGYSETLPKDITFLSNLNFFPTVDDEKFHGHNYTVLVSRVLVEHLDCFSVLKDVCVFHTHLPTKWPKVRSYKLCCFPFLKVLNVN